MKRYLYSLILLAGFLFGATLFAYKTKPPVVVPAGWQAQFGDVSLRIDLATTTAARELGLGGRDALPDDYGMLFVFEKEQRYGFWMKDMRMPIDIFWLDSQGHVVSISEDVATSTYPTVFYPSAPARYVLETAAGFAQAHHIGQGTPLLLKNLPTVSQ